MLKTPGHVDLDPNGADEESRRPEPGRKETWSPENSTGTPSYLLSMAPELRRSSGGYLFEEVPRREIHRLARRWSY